MKHLLLTTIAAVVLVGCGESPKDIWEAASDISIHDAAALGHIKAVKQHLAAGVDVNAKNKNGYTPLHTVTVYGNREIAELLIAKGADVNAKIEVGGYKGDTPLDLTIKRKRTKAADLLRKHGGKTGEELKAEGK